MPSTNKKTVKIEPESVHVTAPAPSQYGHIWDSFYGRDYDAALQERWIEVGGWFADTVLEPVGIDPDTVKKEIENTLSTLAAFVGSLTIEEWEDFKKAIKDHLKEVGLSTREINRALNLDPKGFEKYLESGLPAPVGPEKIRIRIFQITPGTGEVITKMKARFDPFAPKVARWIKPNACLNYIGLIVGNMAANDEFRRWIVEREPIFNHVELINNEIVVKSEIYEVMEWAPWTKNGFDPIPAPPPVGVKTQIDGVIIHARQKTTENKSQTDFDFEVLRQPESQRSEALRAYQAQLQAQQAEALYAMRLEQPQELPSAAPNVLPLTRVELLTNLNVATKVARLRVARMRVTKRPQRELRKRRQDKKGKSQLMYMAAVRFTNRTWGVVSELLDLSVILAKNFYVRKSRRGYGATRQSEWIRVGDMYPNDQTYWFNRFINGDINAAEWNFDQQQFLIDFLVMEIGDYLIGAASRLESTAMNKFFGKGHPINNLFGRPSTWYCRAKSISEYNTE